MKETFTKAGLAQHLADSALAAVLAVDIGFEPLLISAELALQGSGVQVLHPALGLIDLRALPGGADQGSRIQRHGLLKIHAVAVGVLLEAGVHGNPGVGCVAGAK